MPDRLPRISIEVDLALYNRYKNTIPHGMGKQVMTCVLTSALDEIDRGGDVMLAAILSGYMQIRRRKTSDEPDTIR